jgi:hypothetical protein
MDATTQTGNEIYEALVTIKAQIKELGENFSAARSTLLSDLQSQTTDCVKALQYDIEDRFSSLVSCQH